MKKMFIAIMAMFMLAGCGEAPTATIEPEGEETIITETIITENVITEKLTWEEAKAIYYHNYWEDQANYALWDECMVKYRALDEQDYTEKEIWEVRFMFNELTNRLEEDGWVYEEDIDDDNLEAIKALCNPVALVSKEYLDCVNWNLHDIYEYGTTFR